MRIFSGLMFLLLCLAAGSAARAQTDCMQLKPSPTQISVNLTMAPAEYDTSLPRKKMKKVGAQLAQQWLQTNGLAQLWGIDEIDTAGLATGAWAVSYDIEIGTQPFDDYGAYHCVYYNRIGIELLYRSISYIPQESLKNPCQYDLLQKHEAQHQDANQGIAQAYADRLQQDIPTIIGHMETEYIAKADAPARPEVLKQTIKDAVNLYFNESMIKEMQAMNAAIDAPEAMAAFPSALAACGK
jgi:hypothetical protein